MRFLLTAAGIKNTSIRAALVDLPGTPVAESGVLCIPTALYAIDDESTIRVTDGTLDVVSEGHWKRFTP